MSVACLFDAEREGNDRFQELTKVSVSTTIKQLSAQHCAILSWIKQDCRLATVVSLKVIVQCTYAIWPLVVAKEYSARGVKPRVDNAKRVIQQSSLEVGEIERAVAKKSNVEGRTIPPIGGIGLKCQFGIRKSGRVSCKVVGHDNMLGRFVSSKKADAIATCSIVQLGPDAVLGVSAFPPRCACSPLFLAKPPQRMSPWGLMSPAGPGRS